MAGTPTNRTNITLPADMSREILAKMQTESAVMQLARQIELPGKGVEIPVITSDPAASWVSETGIKSGPFTQADERIQARSHRPILKRVQT